MSRWKWCVEGTDGKVIKGWYQEETNWYYLNDEGIMQTGWVKDKDGSWYYMNEQGVMQVGWIQLKNVWYYLEENSNGYKGKCYIDIMATINDKKYSFDKDGHMRDDSSSDGDVSNNLFKFIKAFEGCYLTAYYCPSHVLTIGIGNTNTKWTSLGTITEVQAIEAFKEDMKVFADGVDNLASKAGISLNTYEREALISFSFNVGLGALESSTLWKNICNDVRDSDTITENFGRWNKGSDGVLAGLVRRRACEARLFLTGSYSTEL